MSTTPVVPTPDIHAQLVAEFSALAHKHASVSFWLIGVLLAVVSLAGLGGYMALKSFDAQLAKQDAKDAQYQQDRKVFMDTLAQHDAERAAQAQEIADLEAQIRARDSKPLPKPVQDGLKPGATVEQALGGLKTAYGSESALGQSKPSPDGQSLTVGVPGAQEAISAKVSGDKAAADLKDERSINAFQSHSIDTLNSDLKQCKDLNIKANNDIEGYKKLAKKSRWQKFLGGAEKALLFAGGVYLGHKI